MEGDLFLVFQMIYPILLIAFFTFSSDFFIFNLQYKAVIFSHHI